MLGFSGGANGRMLGTLLDADGIGFRFVSVEGETRICQTLVEQGDPHPTEIVEEMPPLLESEWESMKQVLEQVVTANAVLTISGKQPAGAPLDAYAQIVAMGRRKGACAILDTSDVPLLLALEHGPEMVKINDDELFRSVGEENLLEASRQLIDRGARSVLITRGARSAFYVDADRSYEITPPRIEAVNPVGSGDAVMAGVALAISRGLDTEEMLVEAMACGAANALGLVSGDLCPEDVARLRPAVSMTRL